MHHVCTYSTYRSCSLHM